MTADKPHRGPVPPVFFLLALLAAFAAHRYAPALQLVVAPWNYTGIFFVVTGLAMAALSAGAFHRAGTGIVPFSESTALVTHGFYRFTRNPMYLGMVLVLFGVDVLLGSLTPFLVLPIFALLIQRRFIVHEEALLAAQFGKDYSDFKNRVRRWL